MTLGVDHLQISVTDLRAAKNALSEWGYVEDFAQDSVTGGGMPLPYRRQPDTALCMMRRPGSAVELVQAWPAGAPGRYQLRGVTAGTQPDTTALDCAVRWQQADVEPTLAGVGLVVEDLDEAARVWILLGARRVAQASTQDQVVLEFRGTMFTMPLRLVLERGPAHATGSIDDLGCTQVALLCRDLDADLALLQSQAQPRELVISGRRLRCAFVPGPGGGFIELIEVVR